MIVQLKKTMIAVGIVERSGKSKQALQAAKECRDHAVQEWKQAKVALNSARQSIREFQSKQKVLQNERDLAEARAMEALEENVLMREKEEKLKLMCEAIIKLKEEFLKLEDLHAVEFAKAQEVMNQDICARKESEGREDDEKKWQEEKIRLHSQVQILQKKLVLLELQNQQQRTKRNAEKEAAKDKKSALETDLQALRDEVERVKRLLKDQVVSETRAVDKLEEKIRALQAENVALRVASTHIQGALTDIAGAKEKCEQVKNERKLQRRVDILTLHLKEKQTIVANKDKDHTRCRKRILNLESELQFEQARHEKEHLTQNASAPAANSVFAKQKVEELEFPNAFLRETLALSCKEWGKPFSAKMTSNEAQLQHLRWRLVQNGISLNSSAPDHDMNDTIGHGSNSQIQREEQHFLVGQEVQEESLAHSNELRNKKQHVMAKNIRLLELELENENLRLEYVRLRRKTRCGSGDLKDAHKQLSGAKGIGNGGRRSLWAAHEWLELEDVVKKMKALIKELRAENKKLKKAAAKQASVSLERRDSMRRKLMIAKEF
ncbi:unnamed protein product [Peronospora destructor]|uniref:Uncharacterized protein n=1 Tax=Peronospora destructor TaxID=86335 RepID=A0AAV0VFB7_9STRA|nr:unnamed protein product [Peronospora destructor]